MRGPPGSGGDGGGVSLQTLRRQNAHADIYQPVKHPRFTVTNVQAARAPGVCSRRRVAVHNNLLTLPGTRAPLSSPTDARGQPSELCRQHRSLDSVPTPHPATYVQLAQRGASSSQSRWHCSAPAVLFAK
eukprot:COSAG01_NODE_243_length_20572_cov_24.956137_15_plen_130_part_00